MKIADLLNKKAKVGIADDGAWIEIGKDSELSLEDLRDLELYGDEIKDYVTTVCPEAVNLDINIHVY